MWDMPLLTLFIPNLSWSSIKSLTEGDGIAIIVKKYVNLPMLVFKVPLI